MTDESKTTANALNPLEHEAESSTKAGPRAIRVVAVDDEPSMLDFYRAILTRTDVVLECATNAARGLELVENINPDLVLLDLTMPGMDGIEALHRIMQRDSTAFVVMITGNYSIDTAVRAIREGAADYICKPASVDKIRQLIDQARERATKAERAKDLDRQLSEVFRLEGIIGRGPEMLEVLDLVRRVAPHFRTALIQGETGSGKELVAKALHKLSPRAGKRFSVFNCGAMVDSLAESQLFGHRKGAFTGATQDQIGLFEWADGGTVFLDEIGELSQQSQSKLLRVLETGEAQKIGSPVPHIVDVLLIAATSRDLAQEVKNGRFRSDLLYRLNMVQIQLPPLRDRREDILLLANHFLDQFSKQYGKSIFGISRAAQNILLVYSWPGNVRELENAIGRACMLARGRSLDAGDLPDSVKVTSEAASGSPVTLEDAEKAVIASALAKTKNKAVAARILGISRATLYRLMEKYGFDESSV